MYACNASLQKDAGLSDLFTAVTTPGNAGAPWCLESYGHRAMQRMLRKNTILDCIHA